MLFTFSFAPFHSSLLPKQNLVIVSSSKQATFTENIVLSSSKISSNEISIQIIIIYPFIKKNKGCETFSYSNFVGFPCHFFSREN